MVRVARSIGIGFGALVVVVTTWWMDGVSAQECRADPAPGINWNGCGKRNLMLGNSNFNKATLKEADLSFTDLRDSDFAGADLTKAKLIRTWLAGANVEGADFSKIEAYRAGFQKVKGKGANFSAAELERSDFSDADLAGASFSKAELSRANFNNAVLSSTDFSYANLARADLSSAQIKGDLNFDNAFLFLTRVEGIDLSTSRGLDQGQIDIACGDERTKLPPRLVRPISWPCGVTD